MPLLIFRMLVAMLNFDKNKKISVITKTIRNRKILSRFSLEPLGTIDPGYNAYKIFNFLNFDHHLEFNMQK